MAAEKEPPSYEDVTTAFRRIRGGEGSGDDQWVSRQRRWDLHHPLRGFEQAAQWADVRRSAERLAAYRLAGQQAPLGYYDEIIDQLHYAIELLEAERRIDHGDAPVAIYSAADARSEAIRERITAERKEGR